MKSNLKIIISFILGSIITLIILFSLFWNRIFPLEVNKPILFTDTITSNVRFEENISVPLNIATYTLTMINSSTPSGTATYTPSSTQPPTYTNTLHPEYTNDPKEFVSLYWKTGLTDPYESWSLLTDNFKATHNPKGFSEYQDFFTHYCNIAVKDLEDCTEGEESYCVDGTVTFYFKEDCTTPYPFRIRFELIFNSEQGHFQIDASTHLNNH